MDYLFFQVGAINGYDSLGHYLRAGLIVNTCTAYSSEPQPGCSSKFDSDGDEAEAASAANVRKLFGAKAAKAAKGDDPGADHSAEALRGSSKTDAPGSGRKTSSDRGSSALKLPSSLLPGQAPAAPSRPAPATTPAPSSETGADGSSAAQEGLLDYLLGGDS
jgi:phospholipid/cholesterol/gamma-HCH transport system substrate-binding protein